jgi:Zn-dependent protease with chaperone function
MAVMAVVPAWPAAAGGNEEKAEGYAEWRHGDELVVDGQRVRPGPGLKFKGEGEAKTFNAIPLGYEVKAKGTRQPDGLLLAREIEAKPNGSALFEKEVRETTDSAEAGFRQAGSFYQGGDGGRVQVIGRLYDSGPMVERVERIVDELIPPYIHPEDVRCYVIENPEWNAFAMGNFSIYVFSGLLNDMDDDEVAIVLGHEITHATHEHTRRQFKKQMWIQLAVLGLAVASESVDDGNKRAVIGLMALFGAVAWKNGYGRDCEDQADRVGLRYAFEAGYDIRKGPRLWDRFAKKYRESGKVANFFFGDHSLSTARARKLERQIAVNYPQGPRTDVVHKR